MPRIKTDDTDQNGGLRIHAYVDARIEIIVPSNSARPRIATCIKPISSCPNPCHPCSSAAHLSLTFSCPDAVRSVNDPINEIPRPPPASGGSVSVRSRRSRRLPGRCTGHSWIPMSEWGLVQGIIFSGGRLGGALALPVVPAMMERSAGGPRSSSSCLSTLTRSVSERTSIRVIRVHPRPISL